MPGKHDKAGGDAPSRLLLTGPIAVRGLSRGVKDALRKDASSRHRADAGTPEPGDMESEMQEDRPAADDLSLAPTTAAPPEQEDPTVARRRPKDGEEPDGVGAVPVDPDGADAERLAEPVASEESGPAADEMPAVDEDPAPEDLTAEDPAAEVPTAEDQASEPSNALEDLGAPEAPKPPEDASAPRDEGAQEDEEHRPEASGTAALFAGLGPATTAPRPRRRVRDRVSSGVVGIAVLAILAVVCAGLIVAVVVKTRNDAAVAAREAAAYTPPPLSASTPAAGGVGPIAVIADESAQRAASGVSAAARWPRLLTKGLDTELDLQASAGAGYASAGSGGSTFVDTAGRVPADTGVVLFVGGVADDTVSALSLARAATEAFSAATQQAPGATVIAVGPLFRPAGVDEDDFDALRTSLRSAARIAGIRWVDPVAAGWLSSVDSTSDLSAADERTIASRLKTVVEAGQ